MVHSRHVLELRVNNQLLATSCTGEPAPATASFVSHEWEALEFACVPPPGCTLELVLSGPLYRETLQPFLRPGDAAWLWRWNPHNTVGHIELTLTATCASGHTETLCAALEIVPGKLDRQRYGRLLDDMQQVARDLALALAHSTAGAALRPPHDDERQQRDLLVEYCRFYEERIAALEGVVLRLARRPYTVLRPQSQPVPLEQVRDLSRVNMSDMLRARAVGATASPPDVRQEASTPTTDTYENRVLKRLLHEYWRRVRLVAAVAAHHSHTDAGSGGEAADLLADRAQAMLRRLHALRSQPFLAEVSHLGRVSGPSQVMRRDTSYRRVYRWWQELTQVPFLHIESPLFQLPIYDLPRLYECWCVLQVAQAVLSLPGATVQEHSLLDQRMRAAPAHAPYLIGRLMLREDAPLLVLHWRWLRLRLRYQPRYRPVNGQPGAAALSSLDRHTHVPDLTLELEPRAHAAQMPTLLVFEAKYRLSEQGGVPADALADAYTYLGSIGTPGGARAVQRVALLYPGPHAAEHYPSGVSLLPLLPGNTEALQGWLLRMLDVAAAQAPVL
jgi:large subunit ribosomal protein MRP49